MVLRNDNIGQQFLVPLDLKELIPDDHPCYFIKNVVDQIDCSEANKVFRGKPGEFAYPREMLLRVTLMSVFDGGMSGRALERRITTDVAYMWLAGYEKPSYRTLQRFKKENPDLINAAFEISLKIAKDNDLIKIHCISIDGTKIKAKSSINNITNKEQLEILKKNLKRSIELDEEEDEELGDETGNSVPENLTNPKKFKEAIEEIKESSKDEKYKRNLRASSIKILKQANTKEKAIKMLKKVEKLEEKLEESGKETISINDPDSRIMKNKKGNWEQDYNIQYVTDSEKGIIVAINVSQNPTDHHELIPTLTKLNNNLNQIYEDMPTQYKVLADNGYSTDANTDFLEENKLDGYIASRKLSRKPKNKGKTNPFSKDKFTYDSEFKTYICPLGEILYKQKEYKYAEKPRITHWSNQCKNCPVQEICASKDHYRTIVDYGNPSKIRMQRKMETKNAQEIYKDRLKTELPFAHLKQNIKLNEFTTTGIDNINTEITLISTGYNLKRTYNEINKKEQKTNT